jgi:signal transduction histidine kinase
MFRSIRWRLVASSIFLTLLTISLAGLLAFWAIIQYAQSRESSYLSANAEAIAQQAQPLMSPTPLTEYLTQLAQTTSFFGNFQVRILDSHQHLLADSGSPAHYDTIAWLIFPGSSSASPLSKLPSVGWVMGVIPNGSVPTSETFPQDTPVTIVRRIYGPWGSRFALGTITDKSLPQAQADPIASFQGGETRSNRVVTAPIGDASQPLGLVELSAGTDFAAETWAATRNAFLLAGLGSIVLSMIIGLAMGSRLSKPITNLIEATRRMSTKALSVRAEVHGQDEIGELATQFNSMANQLQTSFNQLETERDALRRFISDASHELRTPITALRNFNELLQGAAADDPQARKEFLAESQTQIDRMAWITGNLLDISRLESGLATLEMNINDARDLVECAAIPFKRLAAEKGNTLILTLPDQPVEVCCDQSMCETALSNLIDNAIKYTPAGGHIEVGVAQAGDRVHIWVQDDGPGINTEDIPHIFERFYRGNDNPTSGSGLGLSIVQSVVQSHGWRIFAENVPGSGARFLIECRLQEMCYEGI